nr:hypothetical protein BaRGS_026689 [Batillaria attramentaria]
MLVLSGYETVHEALVKNADMFSDRPDFTATVKLFKDYGDGIVWNNGASWRELRKFALQGMREIGVGRQGVEEKIQEEVTLFVASLAKEEGQPIEFKRRAMKATNNVISSVVFGRRFEYDDPKMSELLKFLDDLFKPQPALANLANLFPWLAVLPPVKKVQNEGLERIVPVLDFIRDRISERQETFDKDIIRDFVDLYHAKRRDNADESVFREKNLFRVIADLFGAGAETTATSLTWHVLYMLHYPDVQKKCQLEIDREVGRGRPVTLADKASLPYTEATVMEVLRMSNTGVLALPHALNQGGEFRGYTLPPGTMVMVNLRSVHMQPDKWDKPEVFNPQRFIGPDGHVTRPPAFMPFGLGPRSCTGEMLAKQELFLFFANLLQRFHLKPATPELTSLKGVMGLVNSPQPFEVKFVAR